MNCPQCGSQIQEQARFCASCGAALAHSSTPSTQVQVRQDVGTIGGGEVTGVKVGDLIGDLTVEFTVNHVETSVVNGTYVDARTITNNVMAVGPEAMDQIVARLAAMLGADKQAFLNPSAQPVPENVSRQIAEVEIAQKEMAVRGMPVSAEALYQLAMLAAFDRNYDFVLGYFRQATQANPEYADAVLCNRLAAAEPRQRRCFPAPHRLRQSPGSPRLAPQPRTRIRPMHGRWRCAALSPRPWRSWPRPEARAPSARATIRRPRTCSKPWPKLDPDEPGVHNGLGNVHDALGNLDAAISAYRRAIELAPGYTAAHHDLAIAYEAKMKAEPAQAALWRQQALAEWRKTYELAPADPGFTPDYIVKIGKRINWLKQTSR